MTLFIIGKYFVWVQTGKKLYARRVFEIKGEKSISLWYVLVKIYF